MRHLNPGDVLQKIIGLALRGLAEHKTESPTRRYRRRRKAGGAATATAVRPSGRKKTKKGAPVTAAA